jgi:hypothetical protein
VRNAGRNRYSMDSCTIIRTYFRSRKTLRGQTTIININTL